MKREPYPTHIARIAQTTRCDRKEGVQTPLSSNQQQRKGKAQANGHPMSGHWLSGGICAPDGFGKGNGVITRKGKDEPGGCLKLREDLEEEDNDGQGTDGDGGPG